MEEKAARRVDNGNMVYKIDGYINGMMVSYQGSTEMIDASGLAEVTMLLSKDSEDTWRLV